MADVENEVLTIIKTAAQEVVHDAFVTFDSGSWPQKFPCVTVELVDSADVPGTGEVERENLLFDINIYSNKQSAKKAEVNSIYRRINSELRSRNFRRLARWAQPVVQLTGNAGSAKSSNINANIYRLCARYTVQYDGKFFYRRS